MGMEGPVMSASKIPVRILRLLPPEARRAVTRDLPTPPLPLTTPTTRTTRSIDEAEKKLRNGSSIVIFAEGSRTKTGRLGAFKRGAFKIAEDLRLLIVPVSIDGAFDVLPASSILEKYTESYDHGDDQSTWFGKIRDIASELG